MKKFEEGIFSDLRNLKPGVDASLEEPKVSFIFVFCWYRRRRRFFLGTTKELGFFWYETVGGKEEGVKSRFVSFDSISPTFPLVTRK